MIRSRKTQTAIAVLDVAVIGFIIDRITGSPIWGGLVFIIGAAMAIKVIPHDLAFAETLNFDKDFYEVIRTVSFVFIFFIGCLVAAWLILA